MRILVIEDEPLVAESLMKMLRDLEPDAVLEGPVGSVAGARQRLQSFNQPDLIMADIQLEDGVSLDIFNESIKSPIIFTTAYNEYAIRAFKVNSIDYLLKPVDKKDLQAALKKFHLMQQKFGNEAYLQEMMALFRNFSGGKKFKERFAVHHGRHVVLVPASETACFIKEELIYLVNSEGRRFITDYRSLDEVEELVDPQVFFRVNRQFLANIDFIESYRTDETAKLVLAIKGFATSEATISKDKAASFKQWYDQ